MVDENKPAGNLFTGKLQIANYCQSCNTKTARHEFFRILALNMEENSCHPKGLHQKKGAVKSIEELLEILSREEQLNLMNKYDCMKCEKLENATRQLSLAVPPAILTIQLKRFLHILRGKRMSTVKLEERISYQEQLILDCKIADIRFQAQYKLKD